MLLKGRITIFDKPHELHDINVNEPLEVTVKKLCEKYKLVFTFRFHKTFYLSIINF